MSKREALIQQLRVTAHAAIQLSDEERDPIEAMRLGRVGLLLFGEARGLESMAERRGLRVAGLA